jgi:hypothetical protein
MAIPRRLETASFYIRIRDDISCLPVALRTGGGFQSVHDIRTDRIMFARGTTDAGFGSDLQWCELLGREQAHATNHNAPGE